MKLKKILIRSLLKNEKLLTTAKEIKKNTIGKLQIKIKKNNFRKNSKNALIAFEQVSREINCPYWIFFGTLLGAIREKDFIKHDYDLDVGMFLKDYSENHKQVFEKYGFTKKHSFLIDDGEFGREETYTFKGVYIDIFYFTQNNDNFHCHLFTRTNENGNNLFYEDEKEWLVKELRYPFKGFKKINFLGINTNIPVNAHEVLSSDYGDNYMTPDPNYVSKLRKNVFYIKEKIGILNKY